MNRDPCNESGQHEPRDHLERLVPLVAHTQVLHGRGICSSLNLPVVEL
jgi:hypothetical protein